MDPSEFFRSFFGFPGRHRNPHDETGSDDFPFFSGRFDHNDSPPSNVFVVNLDDMIRDMDEMFHGFENSIRNMDGLGDFRNIEGGHNFAQSSNEAGSLRDHMLKEPDSLKDDQDIQGCKSCAPDTYSKIRKWPAFPMFMPHEIRYADKEEAAIEPVQRLDIAPVAPKEKSYFKSVIVQTKRTPDGKIEEHRTVRDGRGREETTVTRKYDGQSHSVTTTKGADGLQQVVENFSNINEGNKDSFESRWNTANWFNLRQDNKEQVQRHLPENELDTQKTSIFKKIFGDYFSSKKS